MNVKNVKWLVMSVVLVLAAVTGILVATNSGSGDAASGGTATQTVTVPPSSDIYAKPTDVYTPSSSEPAPASSSAAETSAPASSASESAPPSTGLPADGSRKPTNIPMTKLAPGEKPPQFVIFSFDGAGNSVKMNQFMDAAAPTNSRFTGFLSGVYLLEDANAGLYQAPGAKRGSSQVGFGGDQAELSQRITDLNKMYELGNEIGTHYNGHFCDLGLNWSTAQWDNELDQFYNFFTNWKALNGLTDVPDLKFPASEVKGGRTPCLNHQWNQVVQAWKDHGMTYDSSQPAPKDGIFWPQLVDGIWEFYMPQVYSAGLSGKVTAMDYNFWVKFNGAKEDPGSASKLTPIVLSTYNFMYDQAYNGNRAPILIANHFNNWNGNSFNPATEQFMRETCGKPDTYCATYQDVIAWMELQDPAVLADLQAKFPVAYQAP